MALLGIVSRQLRVADPGPKRMFGLTLQPMVGDPWMATVNVTVPENPLTDVTLITEAPFVPVGTTTAVGLAPIRKSGEPPCTVKETKTKCVWVPLSPLTVTT